MTMRRKPLHTPKKSEQLEQHYGAYEALITTFNLSQLATYELVTVADLRRELRKVIFRPVLAEGYQQSMVTKYFYNTYTIHTMRSDLHVSAHCLYSAEDIRDILLDNLLPLQDRLEDGGWDINLRVDPTLYTVYDAKQRIILRAGAIPAHILLSHAESSIGLPIVSIFQERTDDDDDTQQSSHAGPTVARLQTRPSAIEHGSEHVQQHPVHGSRGATLDPDEPDDDGTTASF